MALADILASDLVAHSDRPLRQSVSDVEKARALGAWTMIADHEKGAGG